MSGLSLIRQTGEADIALPTSAEADMANEAVQMPLNFGLAQRLPGRDSAHHIVASEHSQRLFHTKNQITERLTVLSDDNRQWAT